jgi:hypothetical protein
MSDLDLDRRIAAALRAPVARPPRGRAGHKGGAD